MGWDLSGVTMLVPLLFLLTGLTVTVTIDPYISRRHRHIMLLIILLSFVLIAQNIVEDWLSNGELHSLIRTATAVLGYSIRPVFLILFLYIVQPGKKYLACWALAGLNWAVNMTAFFSHICFWIDPENHFQRGPLSSACLVVSAILLAYLLFESLRDYRSTRRESILLPVLVVLIIAISVFLDSMVIDMAQPITFLTFAIGISCLFYYIWLHLRFVQEHEDDLKARQRMQIMLSQIQPHFLFNTLSAIQYLCEYDPQAAGKMTERFSRYLQGNMSALKEDGEIPFTQEMEHTRIYLEIEQVRYEDALRVVYDIQCTDFKLPTLTLQPVVENAVRHGARERRKTSGTVSVSTREYPDRYEIVVTDDGPGFDPAAPRLPDDGREHIGLSNVRGRLEQISGGSLSIRSAPGEGTAVTISIPKKQGVTE